MQGYLPRALESRLREDLKDYPIVALLGPRQCGKSTLSQELGKSLPNFLYLDLENPADLNKLSDPLAFFGAFPDAVICLDEIQRLPEIFATLRSVVDSRKRKGQFLLLGSASPVLLRQTSESLAGRVSFLELTPFFLKEFTKYYANRNRLWLQGGFPESYAFETEEKSFRYRENFIRTFLERDIPNLGIRIPSQNIRNFWTMLAHSHGSILNLNKFGVSLGLSYNTIRSYIQILSSTFMVRLLPPFHSNSKKRVVKSDKIYIRDSGILHSLLDIRNLEQLFGHPILGFSWEGFVIENILNTFPDARGTFYRTGAGAEIDLILHDKGQPIAIECKFNSAPKPSRGFWNALDDLNIQRAYIIAPIKGSYPIEKRVLVTSLEDFLGTCAQFTF